MAIKHFINQSKLIFQEKLMTKHLIYIYICLLSTLCASDMVKVTLRSGHTGQGEWIGTYSGHIHLLIEDKVYHYDCNEILSVMIDDRQTLKKPLYLTVVKIAFPLIFYSHLKLIP